MSDWEQFLREVSWFLRSGQNADVGVAQPWTRTAVDVLPELSALLDAATLTPVSIDGTVYELLAWGTVPAENLIRAAGRRFAARRPFPRSRVTPACCG